MLRPFKILSEKDAAEFDAPPVFTAEERKQVFYQSAALQRLFESGKVRGSIHRAHFLLAFGYFKATHQFYSDSHPRDRAFVANAVSVDLSRFEQADYSPATRKAHQELILEHFGCKAFDQEARQLIVNEVRISSRSQIRPQRLFEQVVQLIGKKDYAIPSYQTLAQLIATGYNQHKEYLVECVNDNLSPADRETLQGLFGKLEKDSPYSRYQLTLLKRFSQSVRPHSIQENIQSLLTLMSLNRIAQPVLKKLDLSPDGIRQYATAVLKSEIFQIHRREEADRFLHVIAFIAYQYWRLQDILVDILLTCVTSANNAVEKEAKDVYYDERKTRTRSVLKLVDHANQWLKERQQIQLIVVAEKLSAEEKVDEIAEIVAKPDTEQGDAQEDIERVRQENKATLNNTYLLNFLEERSRKLQNRVADILKHLTFSNETSKPELLAAIRHYQQVEGKITDKAPTAFMQEYQRKALFNEEGTFRTSLYKAILFQTVAAAIKSGALNLENSYKYRSLDSYQIPKDDFKANRDYYLKQADMMVFSDFWETIRSRGDLLDQQFHNTNTHLLSGDNDYVRSNGLGGYTTSHARHDLSDDDRAPTLDLYPQQYFVPLSEAIFTVHRATGCLNAFEHWQHKSVKQRPDDKIFCAGIQGYGCHFGMSRIAKTSRQIDESELEHTINWYFSLDNVRKANDIVLEFIARLPLSKVYQGDEGKTHTSSDGQKYVVSDDSLNANYSFKYGGKERVSSEYTFIDNRNLFFHSEVISGTEREAHYMLDGLLRNDIVKSDQHSTDTHGASEANFAGMDLMNIQYAPRIKNIQRHHLYSISPRAKYAKLDYPILPTHKIRTDMIEPYWDDVLRLIASIKLRFTTASQMYKRLNSYSEGENPIYDALKEYGRIPKTTFILRYIDEPDYRDAITKQLNRGESANKLSRALAIGSPEFAHATKEEQELAESCKRLLKNIIVCWNYMYLSQLLATEKDKSKKAALLQDIRKTSVVSWGHINLQGEYDYSDAKLKDSIGFQISQIIDPKLLDF